MLASFFTTQSIHGTFKILLPALNFACREPEMTAGCEDKAGPEVVLLWAAWGSVLPWGLQHHFSGGSADDRSCPFPSSLSASARAKLLTAKTPGHQQRLSQGREGGGQNNKQPCFYERR